MIEVEIKLPLRPSKKTSEYTRIISFLKDEGFRQIGQIIETDTYFDSIIRPVADRGEALRIRRTEDKLTGKSENVVTFKGKKMDKISMSRQEVETKIEDAEEFQKLLEAMGFFHVEPIVRKHRCYLTRDDMHACLDRVDGLGDFLELEIVIPEEGNQVSALKEIEAELQKAGYTMQDTVTISYLGMLQGRTYEK